MQFIENKSEYGIVKFRLPDVPECLELYGRMGIMPDDFKDKSSLANNGYYLTSKVIANMAFLVEDVKIKVDNKEITSFDQMLKQHKLLGVLCEMAARVLEALQGGSEEKKRQ